MALFLTTLIGCGSDKPKETPQTSTLNIISPNSPVLAGTQITITVTAQYTDFTVPSTLDEGVGTCSKNITGTGAICTMPDEAGTYHLTITATAANVPPRTATIIVYEDDALPEISIAEPPAPVRAGETMFIAIQANTSFTVPPTLDEGVGTCAATPEASGAICTMPNTPGTYHLTVTATAITLAAVASMETDDLSFTAEIEVAPDDRVFAESFISVVGNRGMYQADDPVVSKILWNGSAFVADDQLIVPVSSSAPYVFSFLNETADDSQFRIALSNYDYMTGESGVSQYWFYDPSGAGWDLKNSYIEIPNHLPINPNAFANISYAGGRYLVVSDAASAGNAGGTLHLISMDEDDNYDAVTSLPIPNQTVGGNIFQTHVQDVHVDGDRIFALVVYFDDNWPPVQLNSEVREYKLIEGGSGIEFSQVGATRQVGKNAQSLVTYVSGGTKYLFIPCIGGPQNSSDTDNNGADSRLSIVDITSGIGAEMKVYIGGATSPKALYDFRGIAIAMDGTAYILTGDLGGDYAMHWSLYQTTVARLVSLANTATPGTIANDMAAAGSPTKLVKSDVQNNGYFWSIGMSRGGDGNEYLVFAKAAKYDPMDWIGHDEIHLLKVGANWSDTANADNFIISDAAFNGTGDTEDGFVISSIDISTPGTGVGTLQLK